jgi:D-3-phosphoglycerate dehydrogenase
MSPIAIHRKPRVFSLHPLDPESHALSKQLFDFTAPGEKGFDNWREEAEGIMVRGSAVTAEDVALFGPKLKFIGKHGVGVDRLDLKALKTKGVTVMNTPGVNVSSFISLESQGNL